MKQLVSLASARVPWLLPAVGLAIFVHKNFLCFDSQRSAAHARAKAYQRSRPRKLKRSASKKACNEHPKEENAALHQQDKLDAAGLGHDRLMEWFTEDEVEALHQAQANPAALMSLLCNTHAMAVEYDDDGSDWYTDDEAAEQQGLRNGLALKPLQLLGDDLTGSPMSATSHTAAAYAEFGSQEQQQQQLEASAAALEQQWEQEMQSQLAQELLLQISKARQEQQQQQQPPGQLDPAQQLLSSTAAVTSDGQQITPASSTNFTDSADYFDPSDYFGLSPAIAASAADGSYDVSLDKGGQFLPRAGAMWASSYPPHFDELDWEPDYEPDFDLGFDYEPEFDPGFDLDYEGEGLGFDMELMSPGAPMSPGVMVLQQGQQQQQQALQLQLPVTEMALGSAVPPMGATAAVAAVQAIPHK